MKGSRLIAATMALLMIFACFISVPVFAEGPFDVDGSGDNGGVNVDSSDTSGGEEQYDDNDGKPGWDDLIVRIILRAIISVISHSGIIGVQS